MFINNWVTQRQQRANVHTAIEAVHAELAANRITVREDAAGLYRTAREMLDSPKNKSRSPRACYLWDQFQLHALVLTDAAYQAAISTQALADMPFKQAQRIAEAYGSQRSFMEGRSTFENRIVASGPQTLDMCVLWLQSDQQIDRGLDAAYAPLIGPDKLKWPAPYTGWAPLPSS